MTNDIHPAPAEFNDAEIAADPILHFFHYRHLPPTLQVTSKEFCTLARFLVVYLPRNAERTVALRKLLEAKDAAVRANLPAPAFGQDEPCVAYVTLPLGITVPEGDAASGHLHFGEASDFRKIGEPREVGGHDEDRDGPIPFGT